MNYGRLAATAAVAFVVDMAYGYLVYAVLLGSQFAAFPGVFRPMQAQVAYMPAMALGILIGMFAATFIYAKGYEGGSGVQEGLRFGVLVGLFNAGYVALPSYAVFNISGSLTAMMIVAGFAEWLLVGSTIGCVYRPMAAGVGRAPGGTKVAGV